MCTELEFLASGRLTTNCRAKLQYLVQVKNPPQSDPSSTKQKKLILTTMTSGHKFVVLFYKYFLPADYPLLHEFGDHYEKEIMSFQRDLCHALSLKGRVLIASEGINGTLSAATANDMNSYIEAMENFDLLRDIPLPLEANNMFGNTDYRIFKGVDWKQSSGNEKEVIEPFPDLKVSVVREIISTGGVVSVSDLEEAGQHLTPQQFHQTIANDPDVVLVDVRNTIEYDIGHFIHPITNEAARNPETVTFSSFDQIFCRRQADSLADKKVLMYCTGGIRCEKASVMLKKRGVKNVFQLKGGIHRYLEEFGETGFFKGQNFVFDQRVAMKPSECCRNAVNDECASNIVVGKCIECSTPYDELCGSRICTVCRDPVLVCPSCQSVLREYHCRRHSAWKTFYFTFLDAFSVEDLQGHLAQLTHLLGRCLPSSQYKNVRRTIMRQIDKIQHRIQALESGEQEVDLNAPRRCRTCTEPYTICDGRCWGFWKRQNLLGDAPIAGLSMIEAISVGDIVEPGPNWNELRLGSKVNVEGMPRRGTVVEIKSWGSGGYDNDCVSVQWIVDEVTETQQPQIYRWGVVARDGHRMYDVQKVDRDLCASQ